MQLGKALTVDEKGIGVVAYLVTACLAIFSSIVVYVFGQLLSKSFLDPMYELRKVIGEVRFNLALHAATIHTPAARNEDAANKVREALMKNSSDLIAKLHAVPRCEIPVVSFHFLPPRQSIEEAAMRLRGLSTLMYAYSANRPDKSELIMKYVNKIEQLLELKPLEDIGYSMG